jgi:hypothetical protein
LDLNTRIQFCLSEWRGWTSFELVARLWLSCVFRAISGPVSADENNSKHCWSVIGPASLDPTAAEREKPVKTSTTE